MRLLRVGLLILLILAMAGLLASASLWVRSYFREEFLVGQGTQSLIELGADRGTAVAYRFCYRNDAPNNRKWSHVIDQAGRNPLWPEDTPWRSRFGFGMATVIDQSRARYLAAPLWAITLYFFVAATLLFPMPNRLGRLQRRRSGCCEKCGYDLRGTPTRCPECGLPSPTSTKSFRWPGQIGAAFAIASLLTIGWLIWWSNPRRGAPPGLGANPTEGIDFYPAWEAARGDGPDRMLRRDPGWGMTWYQAIWQTPDGDRLVILRGAGMHMFWDFWGVLVLDQSMKVVRRGSVGLASGSNPCRLFEIRGDNAAIPAAHRGQWLLSVQWQDPPVSTMPSQNHDDVDSASDGSPTDSLNPVLWDTDPPSENPGQWKEVRPLEIRSAERSGLLTVAAHASAKDRKNPRDRPEGGS